jgi:Zyg-11 protein homolog
VYPDKYCKLVESENGTKLLMDLIDHMETCEKLRELAQMVLYQCDTLNQKNFMEE